MGKQLTGNKFMLFLLLWFISVQLILSIVLPALGEVYGFDPAVVYASPWFFIGTQLSVLLLPLIVWVRLKKDKLKLHIPNWNLGVKNIVLIIAFGFLLQPIMMTISGISALFFTNYVSEVMYSLMGYPLWLTLLATAVAPAVFEELVFRGYIQSCHRDRHFKQAAIINGLFFAIIHLSLQQFAYAFIMGIIFFVLVYYTRSIWAGILPHFIINATQGILARWAFSELENGGDMAQEMELLENVFAGINLEVIAIVIIGVFALCLLPVIIILFKEFINHNRGRVEQRAEATAEARDFDTGDIADANYVNETAISIDENDNASLAASKERPSPIDRYVIAVVAVFIVFQLLMNML